jgi:bifunctional DNase/RNase
VEQNKVRLKILGITFSQVQAGAYALILKEENSLRRLPIIIGTPEAQSIAIFLEGLIPPRPLTHDLFIGFIQAVAIELQEVNIYKYEDGIFFSELLFNNHGETLRIDSRTSDAIALAIRVDAPIYTTEAIMLEAGILTEGDDLEDIDNTEFKKSNLSFEEMNTEDLQKALNDAISAEDYEKASSLRDIIKKRLL